MAPRKKSTLTRKSLSKIFSKDKVSKTLGDLSLRLRPRRERRSVLPAQSSSSSASRGIIRMR
ncbi:Mitochondrial presequence protease [Frankliniella fusca]|uniref:Mitochondrial presequence protease n=1 Tax=Frankliniella fusca TaxID=407009 RepID=A0AAE1HIE1_9NEOP|nr:Mitochondrial presequence protease [Frankliniella fusca]